MERLEKGKKNVCVLFLFELVNLFFVLGGLFRFLITEMR